MSNNNWIKNILTHLGLVILASILFSLSFPNPVFRHGFPVLAWFAYIPILIVIRKYNLPACIGWGAIYGLTAYALFNYWLGAFHPMAGLIVYSIYMFFLAVVFVFLKLADILFEKHAYLIQWLVWLGFEYLCTTGFVGYPYGITGYTQWKIIPLIQIASITGVWGVSALVAFPSFWLASVINTHSAGKNASNIQHTNEIIANLSGKDTRDARETKDVRNDKKIKIDKNDKNARKVTELPQTTNLHPLRVLRLGDIFYQLNIGKKVAGIIWLAALVAALVFGIINMKDFSSYPAAQIALIQHNTDPWEASKAPTEWLIFEAYRKDLEKLTRLSDEALASNPKPQLIVWPETAFIPRIYWHVTYRDDQNSWNLVRELLDYLSRKDVPFLLGNDDARMDPALNPDPYDRFRVDYNAAMYFENGINTETYHKMHLVPFTEHFPYQKQLPWMHRMLKEADTHFWEKGVEETVFNGPGFTFSTPICFEDIFGYISRNFVRNGADVIVNITNDAWSNSLPAQNQHLAMAVFRAVENFRPMVRSTATGQTCAIDPNGRVIAEATPFIETWLNAAVPIVDRSILTIYTLYGDYLGIFFAIAAITFLILAGIWYTIKKLKNRANNVVR